MPTPDSVAPIPSAFTDDPLPSTGVRRKPVRPANLTDSSSTTVPWLPSGATRETRAPSSCAQFVIDSAGTTVGHQINPADQWFYYAATLPGRCLREVLAEVRIDWERWLPLSLLDEETSLFLPDLVPGATGVVLAVHRLRVGTQMHVVLTPELAPAQMLKQAGLADFPSDPATFAKLFLRLRTVETRLDQYLSHLPGVIFHQRADLSFSFIGPGCDALLGLESKSLSKDSQSLLRLIHPSDERIYYQELARHTSAQKPFSLVYRVLNPQTGTHLYLLDVRSPVRASNGLLLGYEGVWLDITRQKIAEHGLTTRAWKESLSTLTSGLLNDFSNVMTGIYSLSELYHNTLPPKHPLRDGLGLIKDNSGQAQRLVRKIIDLNRETSGDKTYVNLGKVIRDQLDLLKVIFPRGTQLLIPPADGHWPVYIDETAFRQIVINLAMNARDALRSAPDIRIFLRERLPGDAPAANTVPALPAPILPSVEMIFSDNGSGIAPAHLPRIFDPFFSTKETSRGAGLGLYNAQLFAESHSGQIAARSTLGQGTEIVLMLPLADLTLTNSVAPIPTSSKRTRVLFFEAGLSEESSLVDTLRHERNWEVSSVATSQHARRVLREEGPRLDLLIIRQSSDDAELRILLTEVRRDHAGLPVALALFGPRLNEYLTSLRTQVDLLLPNDIRDRDAADSLAKLLRLP